jgi:hypothetical protein
VYNNIKELLDKEFQNKLYKEDLWKRKFKII